MDKMVSVIIPVYKVEKYIFECLDSVINQTYTNLEIILVDDGSPDRCGEICDEYAKKDSRISVIHKENGGLSDARNKGLDVAKGKYIAFIDSDDFVSPVFIETMMKVVEKFNVEFVAIKEERFFWDGDSVDDLDNVPVIDSIEVLDSKAALERMLYRNVAITTQLKLCSKEIWNNIRFPKGYLYEDVATTYKLFMYTSKVAIIGRPLYAYRKRDDSILRKRFNSDKMICLKIAEEAVDNVKRYDPTLENAALAMVYSQVYSVFLQVPDNDKTNQKLLWMWIKKNNKQILLDKNPNARKKNKYAAVVSYLGMNTAHKIGKKLGQNGSLK